MCIANFEGHRKFLGKGNLDRNFPWWRRARQSVSQFPTPMAIMVDSNLEKDKTQNSSYIFF